MSDVKEIKITGWRKMSSYWFSVIVLAWLVYKGSISGVVFQGVMIMLVPCFFGANAVEHMPKLLDKFKSLKGTSGA